MNNSSAQPQVDRVQEDVTQPDFAIAGAGLLGLLLGWRLASQGYKVSVYESADEDSPKAAAHTAAAMIAPWAELPVCADGLFEMGCASLKLWPTLLADLEQQSAEKIRLGQGGSLLVAHPADQSELQDFQAHMQRAGILADSKDDVQLLSGSRLRQMEPALAEHFQQGFWLPNESHLENRRLLALLKQQIRALGGELRYLAQVEFVGLSATVNGTEQPAGRWLDCRGTGARQSDGRVRGVRGEVVWIEAPDVHISRPVRLLHPRYHLYLVPKEGGKYILGATEIESDDRSPVSVRSALEMLSALYALSPGLAEARILEMTANVRPALPSHKPEIRAIPQGLAINGLFRHGYLLAPAMLSRLQHEFDLPLGLTGVPQGGKSMSLADHEQPSQEVMA